MLAVHNKQAIKNVTENRISWFIMLDNGKTRIPYKGDVMSCGKYFVNVIDVRKYEKMEDIPKYILDNVDFVPERSPGTVWVAVRVIR